MKKVFIFFVCIFILAGVGLVLIERLTINIDGVEVRALELPDYRAQVEASFGIPMVVIGGPEDVNRCFTYILDEEYEFSTNDLFEDVTLKTAIKVDKDLLRQSLTKWNDTLTPSANAYVDTEREVVVSEVLGTQIDVDRAYNDIIMAASNDNTVTLSEYVISPTVFGSDLQDNLDTYLSIRNWVVKYYDTDIEVSVPDDVITLTDDGTFEITNTDFIDVYLDELSRQFNTVGKTHTFVTHSGETIKVAGGTLGDKVDTDKEKETLLKMFDTLKSQDNRVPIYAKTLSNLDTYIEVSLDEQHVWFYKDGELVMDSDCVSGTKGTKRETPTGFWYMDIVMPGKTLYPGGEEKGTWVDRWMRFTQDGCGLHDASWRSKFGGNIYTYNGSHGCVNLPKNFAFELYEYAYVGMPVIVY